MRVDGQQRHEAGDLQQEVHQQRGAGVQREGPHGRHVGQRAQEEAHRLRRRRQEHGRAHLAQPGCKQPLLQHCTSPKINNSKIQSSFW